MKRELLARLQMVLAGVDAVHRQQTFALEVVHAEAAAVQVTAHGPLIGAGGQTSHLQLLVVLVAPEPGRGRKGTLLAQQRSRSALGLFGGVLHRFQAQQAAIGQAAHGAIASSDDGGVAGAAAGIDDDAALAFQACGHGQLVIGQHANAHHHQARRHQAAIGQTHTADLALGIGFHRRNLRTQQQLDAVTAVQLGIPIGQHGRQRAAQQARCRFQHRDRAGKAASAQRFGRLHASLTGADDDDGALEGGGVAHGSAAFFLIPAFRAGARSGLPAQRWP